MLSNITYRDVVEAFKDFLSQHPSVSTVIDEQQYDFQASENLYPAVVIVPNMSTGTSNTLLLNFSIFFCDVLIADKSNTRDVYTETLEIAKDFLAYFTNANKYNWSLQPDFTLTPFEEQLDDFLCGWQLDCTVEMPFSHDYCGL